MEEILLEVRNVTKDFSSGRRKAGGDFRALDNVSLRVSKGESVGIVGESGSGKSTLARIIIKLTEPTSGSLFLGGRDITGISRKGLKDIFRNIQIVFQEPYDAISPRMTIGDFIEETLSNFQICRGESARGVTVELLNLVGLDEGFCDRLPHQLSGGQLQRAMIARALAVRPQLLILDEATSALDVSVQAQILELLMDLKFRFGLTYIFIGHDLAMVRSVTDRIIVMKQGKIVEELNSAVLTENASDEYTKALLSSVYSAR